MSKEKLLNKIAELEKQKKELEKGKTYNPGCAIAVFIVGIIACIINPVFIPVVTGFVLYKVVKEVIMGARENKSIERRKKEKEIEEEIRALCLELQDIEKHENER